MKPRPDAEAEAEAEAWESLDLDDSDLPSFLRPCKRKSPPPQPQSRLQKQRSLNGNHNNFPVLHHCSLRSSQTLTTPHRPSYPPPLPETSSSSSASRCFRTIPGPAGVVQAAMLRKFQKDRSSFGDCGEQIHTQEYIRRVVEELGAEDEDFSRDSWLATVDFVRNEGMLDDDGIAIGTPLSMIKSGFGNGGKVKQVVAMVKSCTPNGLGDLMVTLKDPTGTMDASIHRKVLAESEFGRDIRVGAVLVLQKVAIFAPSRSLRYLNITPNNVVKVITKDTVPSLEQNTSATTVKVPALAIENNEGLGIKPKAFSGEQGRTEGISNNLRQLASINDRMEIDVEVGEVYPALGSNCYNDTAEDQNAVGRSQPLLERQELSSRTEDPTVETTTITDDQDTNDDTEKCKDIRSGRDTTDEQEALVNEQVNLWKEASVVEHGNAGTSSAQDRNEETRSSNTCKKKRPVSKGSLPLWTDEQLDELFAFD